MCLQMIYFKDYFHIVGHLFTSDNIFYNNSKRNLWLTSVFLSITTIVSRAVTLHPLFSGDQACIQAIQGYPGLDVQKSTNKAGIRGYIINT